ncbi:hypothetical protein F4781DRAFT_166087 [Annulohypoxylon bovei var. microspora]|nr:hypothetical protein F4781DRAFT_166087 [Annulohypoxylon bovei var. microspora]
MASMNTIPEEITRMVVELIHAACPGSLNSLALVNSSFHKHVVEFRLRTWTFHHGNLEEDLEHIKVKDVWRFIRRININDYMGVKANLCDSLPKMKMLRDIELLCGFVHKDLGKTLLKSLQDQPHVRLHATFASHPVRFTLARTNLHVFVGSPNLYSLHIKHQYATKTSCLEVTLPLKRILLTCANLRHLTLDIKPIPFGQPVEYCGFGFVKGERPLAALETLRVMAYPFGKRDSSPTPSKPNVVGYPLYGSEQLYWATHFDWTNITQLSIRDTWMFTRHLAKLKSLKEVDLTSDPWGHHATKFLEGIPANLESIKVHELEAPCIDAIIKHGSTLRVLHITSDNRRLTSPPNVPSIPLDEEILHLIQDECPYIEDLGISFRREAVWDEEILDAVAEFPKLRSLTLYFDYSHHGFSEKLLPEMTYKGALDVFEYHRVTAPSNRNCPLREVHLLAGLFHPTDKENLNVRSTNELEWANSSRISFICELDERDDHAARGCALVTCPELSEDENEICQIAIGAHCDPLEMVDRSPTEPRLKTVSTKFRLAWFGPLSLDNWLDKRNQRIQNYWVYRPGEVNFFMRNGIDYVVEDEEDWEELRRWTCHPTFDS